MKQALLERWRSIPPGIRSRMLAGALGAYILLVPLLGIAQVRSAGTMRALQKDNQELEENLTQFSDKLDTLVEDGSSSTVTQELRALRDEVIKYRAEQQGRDQILGLSQFGSGAIDPLDAITQSLQTLEDLNATAAGSPSNVATHQVTANGAMLGTITLLKDKGWTAVDAFESPVASSKIIGQIVVNVSYPFYAKQTDWYQAELASGKKGWVRAQFVKEE